MSIIAFNQKYIQDPSLVDIIGRADRRDVAMLAFFANYDAMLCVNHLGLMPRTGINNLPFRNDFIHLTGMGMPPYDPNFDLSWEEVMDRRAHEVLRKIYEEQKILIVQWSGGIDSTGILVSILKNFPRADLEKVMVACNWGSIIENPVFYHEHILSNFKCMDINFITQDTSNSHKYFTVGGSAADTLLTSMAPGLEQHMSVIDPSDLQRSWQDPDRLIDYLDRVTEKSGFGVWYYEKISESINSVDVPIETYFDFMWWAGFCYNWHTQRSLEWFHHHRNRNLTWDEHQKIYTGWFVTDEFQQWAMNNNKIGIKYDRSLSTIKIVAKKYIYDYTKDSWYFKYKTKLNSAGRQGLVTDDPPFAVTDKFDILYLKKDIESIAHQLPDFIIS